MSGPIRYSRGSSKTDNHPEGRSAPTFKAFVQAVLGDRGQVKGQVWIAAPFNSDGRRCAENVEARRFLPVDLDRIDADQLSDVRLWFTRFRGFGYPTASSTADAPRERVMLELTREATRAECIRLGEALTHDLAEEFGNAVKVDASVFRNEQPVYTPLQGAQAVFYTGDPLDVDAVLATWPEGEKQSTAPPVEGSIPEGGRSAALTSLAGTMRWRGMTLDAIAAALLVENRDKCRPPLPEAEVKAIAASVTRYAPAGKPQAEAKDDFAEGLTADKLMGSPLVPTIYCIQRRVPSGLVLIAGRPKSKKSWLALQIAIAVGTGRDTLGGSPTPGRVLAVLLEDNQIRTRRRLEFFGITQDNAPKNLHLFYDWPAGDLGVAKLDRWMDAYPDTTVMVVDVLQRFRGARDPRQSPYEADYSMLGMLHRLASQHPGLTILVVHHTKKGGADDPVEAISGTFGISGAADAYIVLARRQDGERWAVHIDGRDWEDWNHDFVWEFRQGTGWEWMGILDEDLTDRQAEIMTMAKDKPLSPSTLAESFGISKPAAHEALQSLVKKGALYNQGGKYKPSTVTVP